MGVASVELPRSKDNGDAELASVTSTASRLLAATSNGEAYHWELRNGLPTSKAPVRDVPSAGSHRSWQSACVLASGKIMRLAFSWQRGKGGASTLRPELLL